MADEQTDLRDRIAAAIWERQNPGRQWADCEYRWRADAEADAAAVLAVLPEFAEAHRLALSEALGLGTGAPWDAIHDRATELGLPPLAEDPVAQRLGLVPEPADRAAVLREAADELGRMDYDTDSNDYGYDTYRDAWNGGVMDGADLLRRMADEAQQQPDTETRPRRGDQFEAWLKAQRDLYDRTDQREESSEFWHEFDRALDEYRLHADTGTPLGEHVCEAQVVGQCECLEQPVPGPSRVADEETVCYHSFPDPHPEPVEEIGDCRHCGISYQDAKAQRLAASVAADGQPEIEHRDDCSACRHTGADRD